MEKEHYGAIDGLRTVACIGIVLMHIAANNSYEISGFVYNAMIPSFTDFVFLFMTVSAFSMCCGYYRKIIDNRISFSEFYGKRFKKILPFFSLLVLLDLAVSPSVGALYEAFADLTLMFGFLPNAGNINVIGIAWFLGLVFVFYICFPFFCVLLQTRRRAWVTFVLSLAYNFVCTRYFNVDRSNILYCSCFFMAGGLLYLYRNELLRVNRWLGLGIAALSAFLYYFLGGNLVGKLLVSVSWPAYAVICAGDGSGRSLILENKFTKFVSNISMEIYLSHMVVFRAVEKLGLNRLFGSGWVQYIVTALVVLCGAAVFSAIMQKLIGNIIEKLEAARGSRGSAACR